MFALYFISDVICHLYFMAKDVTAFERSQGYLYCEKIELSCMWDKVCIKYIFIFAHFNIQNDKSI